MLNWSVCCNSMWSGEHINGIAVNVYNYSVYTLCTQWTYKMLTVQYKSHVIHKTIRLYRAVEVEVLGTIQPFSIFFPTIHIANWFLFFLIECANFSSCLFVSTHFLNLSFFAFQLSIQLVVMPWCCFNCHHLLSINMCTLYTTQTCTVYLNIQLCINIQTKLPRKFHVVSNFN